LIAQGFIETRLRSIFKKFVGRYHHLTLPYRISVTTMADDMIGHDIVVNSTFDSLIRHRGHHDGCRM